MNYNHFMVDISGLLIKIENTLNKINYPVDPNLRSLVREYCITKSLQEILLIESTPRTDYLEYAFQLVKNNYAVEKYGITIGLVDDVSIHCLQHEFRSHHFAFSAGFTVRGRWLVGTVIKNKGIANIQT